MGEQEQQQCSSSSSEARSHCILSVLAAMVASLPTNKPPGLYANLQRTHNAVQLLWLA